MTDSPTPKPELTFKDILHSIEINDIVKYYNQLQEFNIDSVDIFFSKIFFFSIR